MSFGGFGAATSSPAKPAFGSSFGGAGTTPSFGAAPASTGNAFGGGGAAAGFGSPPAAGGGTSSFGFPAAGAQKPAGSTSGFGGFGSAPAASGFGLTATTPGFGAAPASTGFGTSTGFGAAPAAGAGTSAFGAAPGGSSFGFPSTSNAFPSNALGGAGGTSYGALGSVAPQQSQWVGGQKLVDISMAYASKVDSSGKPVEVSTEKKDPPTPAQPAAQPAATTWSFASATPAAAAPAAAAQPAINKLCEFEFIAYNSSSNYKQKPYVRPPHVGYRRWLQADRDNPDPDNLTPVLVVGCDGLKKRFSSQCTKAEKIKSYTDGLKEQLELLERSADGAALRYEELKERQRKYFMRLLQVMRKLEVLRAKGISLTPVETRYREKVEELTSAIMVPYEKIQSLESSQAILERQKESFAGPATVSESDFESLCAVLAKQRDGLKHLTDIVKKDARDVAIMEQIISDTSAGRRY